MLPSVSRILLAAALGFSATSVARDDDFVPIDQLMPAVRATLAKTYAKATVVTAERHTDLNAYVYFTITLKEGKVTSLVNITENGDLMAPSR